MHSRKARPKAHDEYTTQKMRPNGRISAYVMFVIKYWSYFARTARSFDATLNCLYRGDRRPPRHALTGYGCFNQSSFISPLFDRIISKNSRDDSREMRDKMEPGVGHARYEARHGGRALPE